MVKSLKDKTLKSEDKKTPLKEKKPSTTLPKTIPKPAEDKNQLLQNSRNYQQLKKNQLQNLRNTKIPDKKNQLMLKC